MKLVSRIGRMPVNRIAGLQQKMSKARQVGKALQIAEDEADIMNGFMDAFDMGRPVVQSRLAKLTLKNISATHEQSKVISLVLGRTFSFIRPGSSPSEMAASRIRHLLEHHWNSAVSKLRGSIEEAARGIYESTIARGQHGRVGERIRKLLFNPIRDGAVRRIRNDPQVVRLLESEAAILVKGAGEKGASIFMRGVRADGRIVSIRLDFDHASTALSRAVESAATTGDYRQLMSIIDPANLQLLTSRENRNVIETVRRFAEQWVSSGM